MLSCHTAPESPGTCSATRRPVPPPSAWGDASCFPLDPVSPRRSAGCSPRNVHPRPPVCRSGCSNPCPDTNAAGHPPAAAFRRSCRQWSRRASWRHARWPRPRSRSVRHPYRPPEDLFWCRFLHDPWGSGRLGPPKTGLAHKAVGTLPGVVDIAETFAVGHQHRPYLGKHALFNPAFKGAMNRGIVTKLPGQMVPLAAAAKAVDDAVERLSRVNTLASGPLGRVQFLDDRADQVVPEVIGTFPNGVEDFGGSLVSGHPWLLSLASCQWTVSVSLGVLR